jgi:HlyD family secretion protein
MKRYVVIGILGVAVLGGIGLYALNARHQSYVTAAVARGPITQEVSASGNVESTTNINLQFQNGGRLRSLPVAVGDAVTAGEVLARQDTSILNAQLQQAQAGVATEQAQLESLRQGTRPEQIAVTQSQIASDEAILAQANQSVINAIQNAYTQSDDAVHNKIDQFFSDPQSAAPQVSFTSSNSQLVSNTVSDRVSVGVMLAAWQKDVMSLEASSDLAPAAAKAQANLASVTKLLSEANAALNGAVPSGQASQGSVNGWIASVATARANVNAALSALTSALTAQQNAAAALDKDQKNLALEQAGSTGTAIAAAQAQVAQTQATVAAIQAQLSQLEIVSPINGVVTAVNNDVGEYVSAGSVVVSLLPRSKLQVGVNLSEDNIVNAAVGQSVTISLDAFQNMTWTGTVSKIDPAQTIIGGAVYYRTTVAFDTGDSRIRSGMTANVLIRTGFASSTLLIPASALHQSAAGTSVEVYEQGAVVSRPVTTGLISQNGMIEVTSGLSEGEEVVTGIK